MAFKKIPFRYVPDDTVIKVQEDILYYETCGQLYYNIFKISSIVPDESKIILEQPNTIFNQGDYFYIIGTPDKKHDGVFEIEAISNDNMEIRFDMLYYYDGAPIDLSSGQAYIANKDHLPVLRMEEVSVRNAIVLFGDYRNVIDLNINDKILIKNSFSNDGIYTVSQKPYHSNENREDDCILSWMENDLYASDTHLHATMIHNILSEKWGGKFHESPGSNRPDMYAFPGDIKHNKRFKLKTVYTAGCTYKSFIDGRVRTIFNALHTPEPGMIHKILKYCQLIEPFNLLLLGALRNYKELQFKLSSSKFTSNWKELKREINFFKNKILKENAVELVSNEVKYNTLFTQPRNEFINDDIIRVLIHIEQGHFLDMDTYNLMKVFAIWDPEHPKHDKRNKFPSRLKETYDPDDENYGGFPKSLINLKKQHLSWLKSDPYDNDYNTWEVEHQNYAVGMVGWTPLHAYWNGIGGQAKMIYDDSKLFMPDPEKFMNKAINARKDSGFNFYKCKHLTEFGRQMVKHALESGMIIDIKHFHPLARNQVLNMAERGFDYDPVYNIYGNPKVLSEQCTLPYFYPDTHLEYPATEPQSYFEELRPGIYPEQNPAVRKDGKASDHYNKLRFPDPNNPPPGGTDKNQFQIMMTHAALSYVDCNASCARFVNDNQDNEDIPFPDDLKNFTIEKYLKIENYIKDCIFYFKYPDVIRSLYNEVVGKNDQLSWNSLNELKASLKEALDKYSTKVNMPAGITLDNIKNYLDYFFITHLARESYDKENMNVDNNEIERIIKLDGVIGLCAEERVIRSNMRFYYNKKLLPGAQESVPLLNINTWPMYGGDYEEPPITLPNGKTVKFLLGKKIYPSQDFETLIAENQARIPMEHQIAFDREEGIFTELFNALNYIHEETVSKHDNTHPDYYQYININKRLFLNGNNTIIHTGDNGEKTNNLNIHAISQLEALYRSIDQIARVAREKVYNADNPDSELAKYALNANDRLNDDDPDPGDIGIRTKLLKYYQNIAISSDFDGMIDPIDIFACPRMYPAMALYIANRLKWDLYRRYYGKDENVDPTTDPFQKIVGNFDIGPERGQTLNVDDGLFQYDSVNNTGGLINLQSLNETDLNNTLNEIVKEIMKQILDTNFINMVANARGWV